MTLELLYVDDCPGAAALIPHLRLMAANAGMRFRCRLIETREQAIKAQFVGSPTVRVNGTDVEPGFSLRRPGLGCRLYVSDAGVSNTPVRAWVEAALDRERRGSR